MKRLWSLLILLVLVAGIVRPAAAQPTPEPLTQGGGPGVTATAPTPPAKPPQGERRGGESLAGSFVVFDPSVGGDTCYFPGATQTFCFRAESFTNDWEFVYNLWQRFPADWTVTNVYVQGTPACTSGSWGSFSWSFETAPYEVNISHPRYQSSPDHCTAYYCFEVVAGTGTPNALESWYWDGDEFGSPPHAPCSSDIYTPPSMAGEPCDEWINPQATIPPCTLPPIMLTPLTIDALGCACEPQQHTLTVWNNAGYDTNVKLTYTFLAGGGICSGPAQVHVPNGTNLDITVDLTPRGSPGDTVVCQVYAEDTANPANSAASQIVKDLIAGYFDPAGWQIEPIAGATPNQWAGGAVGTHPAAVGPVGYVVGGLDSTGALNPDLQMYDPAIGAWTQLTDMPNPRFSPVVGWIGGLLYAAGGYDPAFVATNDLQVYDPATDAWDNTTYTDLPVPRGGAAGGVGTCSSGVGECLFVVGGGPDGSFANTTLETRQYDPTTNAWTQLDNKPAGSSPDGFILGASVGCLGRIYVGGDYRGYHEFYRLDATQPSGAQWTQLASIPTNAGAMTPALVCKEDWGKIVLIGGDPDGSWGNYNKTVYVYDIASDTWEGPLAQKLNVAQLGSVGWHMANAVWTVGGTVGSFAITPMPFESLEQIPCWPCVTAQKVAPATAGHGEVISYTITITAPALAAGMFMTDVLPAGVEYAGNLTYTAGYAWYEPADNAVYWRYGGPMVLGLDALVFGPATKKFAGAPTSVAQPAVDATLGRPAPPISLPAPIAPRAEGQTMGGSTLAILDDFNRADGPIGPNWTVHDGYCNVSSNAAVCGGMGRATFNGYSGDGNAAEADVEAVGTALQYTGLLLNYGVGVNNLFLKVQQQDGGGTFDHAACYTGNNGAGFGLGFFTLSSPFSTAHMRATRVGSDVTIEFTHIDGGAQPDQTYVCSGAPAPEGTGIGILGYVGIARLDNFGAPGGGLEEVVVTFDVTVTAYCGETILNEGIASNGSTVAPFSAQTDVVDDPMIAVEPPALWAEVCPDSTGVLTFTICNEGCPLAWEVHEYTPTLLAGLTPFVPVNVAGPAARDLLDLGQSNVSRDPGVAASPTPMQGLPLLDQQPNQSNGPFSDESCDLCGAPQVLAENFALANPQTIFQIVLWGGYYASDTPIDPDDLTVIFHQDAAGLPGAVVAVESPVAYERVQTGVILFGVHEWRHTLTLATPVALAPGNYWVEIYNDSGWGTDDYFWEAGNPDTIGNGLPDAAAAFEAPGSTWYYPVGTDLAIQLIGAPYPDFPWLSESPVSGTVLPGECTVVEVTFDSTGMASGDYRADLLIRSNDPNNPQVTVPVTMTVPEPATIVEVAYDIDGLQVAFDATAGGSEPLTLAWAFGDGSTSNEEDPVHTYAEGGCYTVTLTVSNDCGQDTWSEEICLCVPVHDAGFSFAPAAPYAEETVSFSGTVAAGDEPFTWAWDFGDGGTAGGQYASHIFAAGTYTATLTVSNACGEAKAEHVVVVKPIYRIFLPLVFRSWP